MSFEHEMELRFKDSFSPDFISRLGAVYSERNRVLSIECEIHSFHQVAKQVYGNRRLAPYLLGYFSDPLESEKNSISIFFRVSISPSFVIRLCSRFSNDSVVGSIVDEIIPAAWMEREMAELYGVKFSSPQPPLVLHAEEPNTFHFSDPGVEGGHQVAVGPIHAGIIEPGHLRFFVRGEKIYSFQAHLFFTHKGLEKMAVGKSLDDALSLAEHVCGLCACTHAQCFAKAVESFLGMEIPVRAKILRAVLLELERLNYHCADLAAICASGGLSFASMQAAAIREQLLRRTKALTGHRFFRGIIAVGGLKRDINAEMIQEFLVELKEVAVKIERLRDLITTSDTLLDRLETTGTLSESRVRELGLTGPAARGSGVDFDLRRDGMDDIYDKYAIQVPVYKEGDCWARTMVRLDEWRSSLLLIEGLLNDISEGPVCCESFSEKQNGNVGYGIGAVESAKGETAHFIRLDQEGKVARWNVRSASYFNWAGMVAATSEDPNNIVADGPLINKSFNLCYACTDR
jgi:Ni,Fe-hydrogenase III large subunit/Ni,Fe-hydrogenase III component G